MVERADALNALPVGDPRRLADEAVPAIQAGLPELRRSVEVVGALGLPKALNHNDLHGGNVFAEPGEVMRFFDLGDAMFTDPLGVLRLRSASWPTSSTALPTTHGSDRSPRPWSRSGATWHRRARSGRALPHALRLARLARHESWLRATPPMSPAELADWGMAASAWLARVPDPPLLTPAAS